MDEAGGLDADLEGAAGDAEMRDAVALGKAQRMTPVVLNEDDDGAEARFTGQPKIRAGEVGGERLDAELVGDGPRLGEIPTGDRHRQAGMQAADRCCSLCADAAGAADDEDRMLYAGHLMVSLTRLAIGGLAFLLIVSYFK